MINGPCLRNLKNKYNRNNSLRFERHERNPQRMINWLTTEEEIFEFRFWLKSFPSTEKRSMLQESGEHGGWAGGLAFEKWGVEYGRDEVEQVVANLTTPTTEDIQYWAPLKPNQTLLSRLTGAWSPVLIALKVQYGIWKIYVKLREPLLLSPFRRRLDNLLCITTEVGTLLLKVSTAGIKVLTG